ncbi:gliding motility protein GldL, partial [Vicingaceae bacterium]|nr:gliding motility protein GldL [Vicingaceae bacterium]
MGIVEFLFETKKGKKMMGLLYGMGAAVVIVGALFKIEHWPGASAMLITGLSVEALIFAVSAFEPPHSELDWTLAYPELAGLEDDTLTTASSRKGGSASQELDQMLEDAKIGPELIESLGTGFKNLADHTSKLNDITDVGAVSNEFAGNIKDASSKMVNLSASYEAASETLTGLTVSSEDSNAYSESVRNISSKLSELNNVYELQLKSASEHMQASNSAFEGMDTLMNNLNSSIEGTEKYK